MMNQGSTAAAAVSSGSHSPSTPSRPSFTSQRPICHSVSHFSPRTPSSSSVHPPFVPLALRISFHKIHQRAKGKKEEQMKRRCRSDRSSSLLIGCLGGNFASIAAVVAFAAVVVRHRPSDMCVCACVSNNGMYVRLYKMMTVCI